MGLSHRNDLQLSHILQRNWPLSPMHACKRKTDNISASSSPVQFQGILPFQMCCMHLTNSACAPPRPVPH